MKRRYSVATTLNYEKYIKFRNYAKKESMSMSEALRQLILQKLREGGGGG